MHCVYALFMKHSNVGMVYRKGFCYFCSEISGRWQTHKVTHEAGSLKQTL